MLWHILKYLLSFSVPSFYRKIQIKNAHYLKNNHPAIIASNHPNAFMDPISFSYMIYPPRVRYMARGDAFKPGLISKLLESIGIIPIFRMQDAGTKGVRKNNESYKIVYNLLRKNKKVMIFAEGICIQEKRLRPIKKGVPRLIFTAQEQIPDKDILVVPVCMNYSNPSELGSTLFINVGEPFTVKNEMSDYLRNPNQAMQKMMNDLYQKMLPLTIHIERTENDLIFEKTRTVLTHKLCELKNLNSNNLEHVFMVEKEISEFINKCSKLHPEKFQVFSEKISHIFNIIKDHKLHVESFREYQTNSYILALKILMHAFIFIPYTALYFIVSIFMFLPYTISHTLAKKSSPSKEFYASFFLAFSTFVFLFYYLIIFFTLKSHVHPFILALFFTFSLSFVPAWHYYSIYQKKVTTLLKILKNKTFALKLSKSLQQVLSDYDYLKQISIEY